jgi:hypothetical protein
MPTSGGKQRRRAGRIVVAMVLIAVATWAMVVEPFSHGKDKGQVLVTLTRSHGIDSTDLPAIGLYLVAAGLLGSWLGGSRR